MEAFLKYLINGITLGGMYALVALGYTMVYGIIKLINFAHGDILMVGAFLGFFFLSTLSFTGLTPLALLIPATLLMVWWGASRRLWPTGPAVWGLMGLCLLVLIAAPLLPVPGSATAALPDLTGKPALRLSLPAGQLSWHGLQVGTAWGPDGSSRRLVVKERGRILAEVPAFRVEEGPQTLTLPDGAELSLTPLSGELPDLSERFLFPFQRALLLYAPWLILLLLPVGVASGLKGVRLAGTCTLAGLLLGVLVVLHLPFAVLAAMFYSALLGVSIERLAYRPLRTAPRIAALITAIGVSLLLENAGMMIWGERHKSYSDLNPTVGGLVGGQLPPLQLGLVTIGPKELLILVVTIGLMAGLQYLVMRTRVGKAMRAVSMDRDAARLMGINVDATISVTFAIGSALAAAAGVFWGIYYNTLNPVMGIWPGIKAFVAAVLGGIGSIPGAMAGGLVMGVAENLVVGYLASSYRDAIAFSILILILLVKPTGLFGSQAGEKV